MENYRVIFLTGAGISADSGIPTFQAEPGIRDKLYRTYARRNTEDYRETIRKMKESCEKAEPNAAHKAIAELKVPVITMNIDMLHQRAGSHQVLAIHGRIPNEEEINAPDLAELYDIPVLYGDPAPLYSDAIRMMQHLKTNDSLVVVVGTSFSMATPSMLLAYAERRGAKIVLVNREAAKRVPVVCERIKDYIAGGRMPDFGDVEDDIKDYNTFIV